MKQIFVCLLMLVTTIAGAQSRPGSSTYHSNADTPKVFDIREKLVQLAMQNPNYEVADRTVNKALYELRKAKGSWLGSLSATANVNEFTLDKGNPAANFYPRYNFSVNIPLDIFTNKSNDIKIARENYLIAEANRNDRYREIRAVVLTMYEDYLMYKERLESQIRVAQDDYTIYLSKERDFQDGIVNQEEYNKALKAYEESRLRRGEYQRNFNVSKYDLERMIGMSLEEALATK
ncbi:MAG TPA: TolC family protein [Chitinophagaceae bacterium]|nr:TolC family protein [Chitinophagaceae bacterium]